MRQIPTGPYRFAGIVLWLLSWGSILGVSFCAAQQASPDPKHSAPSTKWIQNASDAVRPCWGIEGRLTFGIHSNSGKTDGEPRGLIRIYSPVLPDGKYKLINFIAIEPIVAGRRGFSEMEMSRLDHLPGKRMWMAADSGEAGNVAKIEPGKITRLASGAEQLELTLRCEKFNNGAHVYLVITQRSDAPDEIELTVHEEPDSKKRPSPDTDRLPGAWLWCSDRATQEWVPGFTLGFLSKVGQRSSSPLTCPLMMCAPSGVKARQVP